MRGGEDQGLIRWVTLPSFGDGKGMCDISLSRLTRKLLTGFLGEAETAIRLSIQAWFGNVAQK